MSKVERLDAHGNVIETLIVTPEGTSLSIGGGETATLRVVLEPGDKPVTLSRRDEPVSTAPQAARIPLELQLQDGIYTSFTTLSALGQVHPVGTRLVFTFTVPPNVNGYGRIGMFSMPDEQPLPFELFRDGISLGQRDGAWRTSTDMVPGDYEVSVRTTTDDLAWRIEAELAPPSQVE